MLHPPWLASCVLDYRCISTGSRCCFIPIIQVSRMLEEVHCSLWAYRMSTHLANVGTSPLQAFFLVRVQRLPLQLHPGIPGTPFISSVQTRATIFLPSLCSYPGERHCWEVCQRGRTHAGLSSIFPALTSQASEAFTPLHCHGQLLPICHTVIVESILHSAISQSTVNVSRANWPLYSFWPWLFFD